ncbi:hypothetical protein Tco_0039564 [Tanacetum coccineum]
MQESIQGRVAVPAELSSSSTDLEYLKGGSLSRKYTTSTTKTKAAKYDNIEGIKDMVPTLWSPVKWYDYGYLEEIEVRREDESLYKFKEDIVSDLRMEYLPKRRWSKRDKSRSHVMIKKIYKQLYERRLMRNLEKFVGGREYGEDFRLLEWTI